MNQSQPMPGLRQNAAAGIFYMCIAVLMMPVMNATAKSLTVDYPLMQVVWARFTGHLVFMTLIFWPVRGWRLFRSAKLSVQLARSGIMFLSNSVYIAALSTVALATASAIMFTAPLIVTALSPWLLKEQVGIRRWLAVFVGFVGALIIIRPGMDTPTFDATGLGLFFLFVSSCCFAIYQILTRMMSDRDTAETNIVYTGLVAALVLSCFVPYFIEWSKSELDWTLFGLVGVLGGLMQYFVAKALEQAPASVVSPYLYAELIVAAMVGYAVFGDFPDMWTWVGATVIAFSGIYIAYREAIRARQKNVTSE